VIEIKKGGTPQSDSAQAACHVLDAAVPVGLVRLVALPAAPDHSEPGAGEDPHGMGAAALAIDRLLAEMAGPARSPTTY